MHSHGEERVSQEYLVLIVCLLFLVPASLASVLLLEIFLQLTLSHTFPFCARRRRFLTFMSLQRPSLALLRPQSAPRVAL